MDALDAIISDMDRERGSKGNEERDVGSFKIPKRSANPRVDAEMGSAKRDRSSAARPAEYRDASSSRHHQDEPMDTSPPRAYAASRSTAGARTNIAPGKGIEINKTSYQIKLASHALIQKYQVEVMYTVRARGKDGSPVLKEKNAAIGPHNPVARQQRRIRLFEIISVVLNNEPEFGGMEHRKDHIYDCGNCVMSLSCGLRAEHGKKIFAVNHANLSKETIESLGGEKLESIKVSFEWTRQFSPQELNEESNANEVKQFLEILTSQELIETGGYLQYGNSFFERSSSRDIPLSASSGGGRGGRGGRGGGRGGYGGGYGDRSGSRDSRGGYGGDRDRSSSRDGRGGGGEDTNKVLKCGFEKSIGFTAGMVPVLNIDARKSPFSKSMPLLDFLKKEIGARESREVEDGVRDRRKKKEMLNMLRGLVVKTTHMPVPHYIVCSDIVKDSARKMTFEYKGEETSVEKYFELQYQIKLRYPHLPLVVEKKVTGKSYHPIEVLVVAEGQKIRTDQISADVQDAMIGMARASPDQVLRETQQQMEQANLNTGRNSWLEHFGVSVSRDRVQAKGEVLCPPTIEFARQKCEPRNGELRFSAGEFVKGAKLTKMVVVIFDRCMRIDDASRFLGSLADSARSKGMSIDARSARMIEAASEDPERLRCYFKEWMQEGVQMMIGITQQKKDPVHDTLKDFERMGLVTQHLCKQTVDKIANRQGGAQTIDNVLMKMNCKGGGTNYHIQPSREWLDRSGNIKDYDWFGADYMYIGVDVSHPGVQHAFDRARGEAVDPTVVGMVYTKGRATEMVGTYWLQQARVNIFQMEGQVLNALLNYFDMNKMLPKHMVVFRGGLSEGETAPVSASEAAELEEAIKRAVDSTRSPHKPTLTIVCAMVHNGHKITRSERDMPRGGKPMEMNLPPGTCIDSGITDPRFKEFYLVSQRGLMGTSSCTIYRVTKEDALAPHDLKKIETITNSLSAGHGVFTGTVSRPAPLYNASKLAERARDTMNHQSMSDDMSVMSGASGSSSRFRGEGAEFFERASEELATQLAGKLHFWA